MRASNLGKINNIDSVNRSQREREKPMAHGAGQRPTRTISALIALAASIGGAKKKTA
jgi:hypothetical protein